MMNARHSHSNSDKRLISIGSNFFIHTVYVVSFWRLSYNPYICSCMHGFDLIYQHAAVLDWSSKFTSEKYSDVSDLSCIVSYFKISNIMIIRTFTIVDVRLKLYICAA